LRPQCRELLRSLNVIPDLLFQDFQRQRAVLQDNLVKLALIELRSQLGLRAPRVP
jgi:hypothetical protein